MTQEEKARTTAIMAAILATRTPPINANSVVLTDNQIENLAKVAHQLLFAVEELQAKLAAQR